MPQTVLVTRMLTHDITSTGAVEGVPSGAPPRTRFQIICWSTIAKTPYRAPKGERGERAGGARGYRDAHPDCRNHYGDQGGRPGRPSQ